MILVTMQNFETKNDNKKCLVSIILVSCRSIWQLIKIIKPQKYLIKRYCTFFSTFYSEIVYKILIVFIDFLSRYSCEKKRYWSGIEIRKRFHQTKRVVGFKKVVCQQSCSVASHKYLKSNFVDISF